MAVPIAASVAVVTAPLRSSEKGGAFVRLTTLDALSIGAAPQLFQVLVERTDAWLKNGNPWELYRPKLRFPVGFGGSTRQYVDEQGRLRVKWEPESKANGTSVKERHPAGAGVQFVGTLWTRPSPGANFATEHIPG